ncbi:zinc finger CCCH domain-containing protein 24 [Dendrobium catenatum]|uniref:Zinc finger CCCH domain-containing protein 24 n=1 Tax=Dendrobium catenatum TaxID=906689 RepID=A0A2I0VWJ5_9ASPA|nr:zinc finger CCCH domain-containing protein 24 [Dendrobium catenatum]PKU67784.1 Zinc finger CCCH domain-containing protein 24 [Dendrobium catenatum]
MNHLTVETEDSFSSVLELAANNDVDGFKRSVDRFPLAIDEIGDWYGRKKVVEQRTPLMVAATYGSIDVLKLILSLSSADVNRCCGSDRTTALHCAASGGSANAVETVKFLLLAGADPNCKDAQGNRPGDLIIVPPKLSDVKATLEKLLGNPSPIVLDNHGGSLRVSASSFNSNYPLLSSSSEEDLSPFSDSTSSPLDGKFQDNPPTVVQEKKEYPIDPSLPDIKNSIYATDEFRMFSFKVRPCSRAYSHDWTECPFVHPGENARRRDPRKYHYSCVPCPDFRKGSCRRADMCEYAHGVFECWLHPAQYRTRLCKDGTSCSRRVCFFAHTNEELRPLYMSTGSAVPSPRSSSALEMAAMGLMPSSPSSVSAVVSPFTPPMSPSANGNSHSIINWPQQNVPALHLPGSILQSSRLRSSFSARDMPKDEFSLMQDFDSQQLVKDLCVSRLVPSASNRVTRQKILCPSNLDDLFSSEISSPRYNSEQGTLFSPSLKASNVNHFQQQQQQSILSTVNTGFYSQKVVDHQLPGQSSFLQASFGLSSPGRLSPRSVEPISPMYSCPAAFSQREKQLQPTLLGLSSRDLGTGGTMVALGSPLSSSLSKWGSPSGTLDWGVNNEELGWLKRSSLDPQSGGEEPDVNWVNSLVKESPPDKPAAATTMVAPSNMDPVASADDSGDQIDSHDQASLLGAWLDKMQLDQMVV